MSLFSKKKTGQKIAPAAEEPKKTVSLNEMKIKFNLFSNKVKEYENKQQAMLDRHIQRATALKMKGMDAKDEIRRIAFFQTKIQAAEKRRAALEMCMENFEASELDREFLATMSGFTELLCGADINQANVDALARNITDAGVRIAEQQARINQAMDDIDSTMLSLDGVNGNDVLASVEKNIDSIINQTIADAGFSEGTSTPEEVAREISGKIRLTE